MPRLLFAPWWEPFGNHEPGSVYDTGPLYETLGSLVDFDLLNGGPIRFSATAVELEGGREVVFDTREGRLDASHLSASSALIPAFPAVKIDGTLLADAGASANLPVDLVLSDPPLGPTLCLAIDLLPLRAPPPVTLGEAAERMQDLIFASQSRRAIESWKRYYDLGKEFGTEDNAGTPAITLVHLAYAAQEPEACGKAFDFSPGSAAYRWQQGHLDMRNVLDRLDSGHFAVGTPGLSVHSFHGLQS
jgi:NTE family protein